MITNNAGRFPRILNLKGKGQIPTDMTVQAIAINIPTRDNYSEYELSLTLDNEIIVDGNMSGFLPYLYLVPAFGIKKRTPFVIKPDDVEITLLGQEGYNPTPKLYIKGITIRSNEERVIFPVGERKIFEIYDITTRGEAWEFSSGRWLKSDRRFQITADRNIITENTPFNSPVFVPSSNRIPFITPFRVMNIEFYHGKGIFTSTLFWSFILIGYLKEVDDEHDKGHKAVRFLK